MSWFAKAPANIALIKYMGKKDETLNLPDNPSLSYTLDNLLSSVSLEHQPGKKDFWGPLNIPGSENFQLSTKGQERFLAHLAFIKQYFRYEGAFLVKSNTNFPQGTGLASSASSFAALTKAALLAITEIMKRPPLPLNEASRISRQGSGSSCRSFFSPWAIWETTEATAIDLPYKNLIHEIVLISHEQKKISSSEAHRLVKTSKHYAERPERAKQRLHDLIASLSDKNWAKAYEITWDEFHDMHLLFETAEKPFYYMTEESKKLLHTLQKFWDKLGDGPLVTMDAGPNIHLLYRPDQEALSREFKKHYLIGNYDVL